MFLQYLNLFKAYKVFRFGLGKKTNHFSSVSNGRLKILIFFPHQFKLKKKNWIILFIIRIHYIYVRKKQIMKNQNFSSCEYP